MKDNSNAHIIELLKVLENRLGISTSPQDDTNSRVVQLIEILNSSNNLAFEENTLEEISAIQEVLFSYSRRDFSKKLAISDLHTNLDALKLTINIHGEELEDMIELVNENNRLKDQFLANVSHEIRTPLNAIIGFSDILSKSPLGRRELKFIESINKASNNLLTIVNDLLDFSKITSSKIQLETIDFNFLETLDDIKILLSEKANNKGLNFRFFVESDVPEQLIGDPTKLKQILINLLGNAIKFTDSGSVQLFCDLLEQSQNQSIIQLKVVDTGIGIAPELSRLIFERFRQASSATNRSYGGTGLGLSITKEIVQLMNGEIELESEEGKGTTITLTLPFENGTKPDEEVYTPTPSNFLFEKVLLVEDNIFNQMLAQNFLEEIAEHTDLAENGLEALEFLQKNQYDIILLDIQMPIMDGYECTQNIRKELKLSTPIVAITAHSISGEKEKCLALGMDDFITKPYTQEILLSTLKKYSSIEHKNHQ